MIIDEIKKEVAIENPFELLHRQIAFFGNTEENTNAVYFCFLDEDGYREKDFTFYSFSDFEEKSNIQAYMHFGEDNGNIWKENCFKIVLSLKFYEMLEIIKHSRIEVINEDNIRKAKVKKYYSILNYINKCNKNKSDSCTRCDCRNFCVKSGLEKEKVQKNIGTLIVSTYSA